MTGPTEPTCDGMVPDSPRLARARVMAQRAKDRGDTNTYNQWVAVIAQLEEDR